MTKKQDAYNTLKGVFFYLFFFLESVILKQSVQKSHMLVKRKISFASLLAKLIFSVHTKYFIINKCGDYMTEVKRRRKKKGNRRKSKERRIIIGGFFSIILIIYLIGSGVRLTKKIPLSIEIVQLGTIDNNIHVRGTLIRNETVINSKEEGNIKYFVYEGEKIKSRTPVCMVANDLTLSKVQDEIDKINGDIIKVQNQRKAFSVIQKDIQEINYEIYDLVDNLRNTYTNKNYIQLYSLKNSIKMEIEKKQILLSQENSSSLQNLLIQKEDYEKQLSSNSDIVLSPYGGIISYYIDGLEEKLKPEALNNLTKKDLDQLPEVKDVSQVNAVKKDSPLFKIVDNYDWYVAGIVSKELAQDWKIHDEVLIRFNGIHSNAIKAKIFNLIPSNNEVIIVLQSTEQMLPLISKRNVEFEIIRTNSEGIKIPINAIVEKTLLKVPKEYVQQSGKGMTVIKRGLEKDELIYIEAALEDTENIYILQDISSIKLNDTLVLSQNPQTVFIIKESKTSIGVFAVNGGIIRFKQIEILVQNKEYAIVKQDTNSGIRLYDQIVSNAKNAKENQLLNQFNIIENN